MNVSPIKSSTFNFKANENEKRKGGGDKAIASAFIPGLGQFCDGRNKAGFGFLLGDLGLKIVTLGSAGLIVLQIMGETKKTVAPIIGVTAAGLATWGLWITNIVNAYKGGFKKSEKPTVAAPQVIDSTKKQETSIAIAPKVTIPTKTI